MQHISVFILMLSLSSPISALQFNQTIIDDNTRLIVENDNALRIFSLTDLNVPIFSLSLADAYSKPVVTGTFSPRLSFIPQQGIGNKPSPMVLLIIDDRLLGYDLTNFSQQINIPLEASIDESHYRIYPFQVFQGNKWHPFVLIESNIRLFCLDLSKNTLLWERPHENRTIVSHEVGRLQSGLWVSIIASHEDGAFDIQMFDIATGRGVAKFLGTNMSDLQHMLLLDTQNRGVVDTIILSGANGRLWKASSISEGYNHWYVQLAPITEPLFHSISPPPVITRDTSPGPLLTMAYFQPANQCSTIRQFKLSPDLARALQLNWQIQLKGKVSELVVKQSHLIFSLEDKHKISFQGIDLKTGEIVESCQTSTMMQVKVQVRGWNLVKVLHAKPYPQSYEVWGTSTKGDVLQCHLRLDIDELGRRTWVEQHP